MQAVSTIRHCRLYDIPGAWTSIGMSASHHEVTGFKRELVCISHHGSSILASVALILTTCCALAHRGVVMEITKDQVRSGLPSAASLFPRLRVRLIEPGVRVVCAFTGCDSSHRFPRGNHRSQSSGSATFWLHTRRVARPTN
jgi:hypothetical protein